MTETMKALVYEGYGRPDEVLGLRDVEIPVPGDHEVLVKVHAASVNPLDWHLMTGRPVIARASFGLFGPQRNIPGVDLAGTVEAVGKGVTEFVPGDEVFGESRGGAHAEYVIFSWDGLVPKPSRVTFEEAAAVPLAAATALQGLRDWGDLQPGDKVLINGASGAVGTFAIQIARALGAAHVTAVCSTRNVEIARSLGADRVVDYTQEDFTRLAGCFDLIFDIPSNRPFSQLRPLLDPEGVYVMVGGPKGRWIAPFPRLLRMQLVSAITGMKSANDTARRGKEDLLTLQDWLSTGKVGPIIDRNYKLAEVPEA